MAACDDELAPARPGRGYAEPLPEAEADANARFPAFLIPDAESYSGWRHYYVRRKPGAPEQRRPLGYR